MRIHPLNRATLLWLAAAITLTSLVLLVVLWAAPAHASVGFEPTDAVLACIRRIESHDNYRIDGRTYDGAYQANRAFALAYSAGIPAEMWESTGSDRSSPTWTWAPAVQDEMARAGLRSRGLQPWPTPRRRCNR